MQNGSLENGTAPQRSNTPKITEFARAYHERMFPGYESDFARTDPEFIERFDNWAFDEVLHAPLRPDTEPLSDRVRFMAILAALVGCQGIDEFRAMVPAALEMGVGPVEVKEIVYQASAYLGIGRVFPFLKAVNEVFEARGIELPLPSQATTEPDCESRVQAGEAAQVEIFGEGMRGYAEAGDPAYPEINRWLACNCFGDWYTRGGLNLAERELMTFCFLSAQGGCEPQLASHAAANMRMGNTKELLLAVACATLPFIGYPRTLNAIRCIEQAAS